MSRLTESRRVARIRIGDDFGKPEEEELPELPSWDEAPEWAQWRVLNSDGMLVYFENKPKSNNGRGHDVIHSTPGQWFIGACDYPCPKRWQSTIEQRPFEPPWDKIASPYDEWLFLYGEPMFHTRAGSGCSRGSYFRDLWSSDEDLQRASRKRVYTRPNSE